MIRGRWLRVVVPALLVVTWFGLGSVGGPIFGKISEVSTNDQAAFLPSSAESTRVQQLLAKYDNGRSIPAVVLLEADQPFGAQQLGALGALADKLAQVPGVQGRVAGPVPSADGRAAQFIVPLATDGELKTVVPALRTAAQAAAPPGVQTYVTGPAGLSADLARAFGGVDGLLLAVALAAVLVILLLVYRSLLLPVLVLLNSVFALCAAIWVVYLLAKHGFIELNGQSQGILSILVIGAATDYSLLLVARYREALAAGAAKWSALGRGLRGSVEPIVASAATVILALLCLLVSDLNSNRSLGPIAATGIVFALLATLSFLPALLAVAGRAAFWPSKVRPRPDAAVAGLWRRVGNVVAAHARATWVIIALLLAAGSLGLLQLKAGGVPQTDLVLSRSNAADGQQALARHFSAGAGAPTLVAVPQVSAQAATRVLQSNPSVTAVMAYGQAGRTSDLAAAKVVDGQVLLSATLAADPYSDAAETVVADLRRQLAAEASGALVGGPTALAADTSATATRDLRLIVPLVLVVIFIVLALLLRALVAPLLLIGTVVLSFGATLGVAALVFNHLFQFPGSDAAVPLFGFVFLVALGVDYNIFLVSRTREETAARGTRAAMLYSLGKTGGVITSAGVVLAATFAALGVIPILFLAQIAFIVAVGVLLDTLIVRSLLVPALFHDLGPKVWWPSQKLTK